MTLFPLGLEKGEIREEEQERKRKKQVHSKNQLQWLSSKGQVQA